MRGFALSLVFLCLPAGGRDLAETLRAVERRYNGARTLRLEFRQSYTSQGRKRLETGSLSLMKPGRMRWEYRQPEGKLLVSDGKWFWFYSPYTQRVEKSRLKQSEDFRAPLAFLLGRLDFRKDFIDFQLLGDGPETVIRALPKSDRAPYTGVEFAVGPENEIRRLIVRVADGSVQEFHFAGEQVNAAVPAAAFRFAAPAGAEVVEVESFEEQEP